MNVAHVRLYVPVQLFILMGEMYSIRHAACLYRCEKTYRIRCWKRSLPSNGSITQILNPFTEINISPDEAVPFMAAHSMFARRIVEGRMNNG